MRFHVYALDLDPRLGAVQEPHRTPEAVRGYRYVGSSAHTGACRARLHAAGGHLSERETWPRCSCDVAPNQPVKPVGSNVARDYGRGLVIDREVNGPDREAAWEAELMLGDELVNAGYAVYTDQRAGSGLGMYPVARRRNSSDPPVPHPSFFDRMSELTRRAGLLDVAAWAKRERASLAESWFTALGVIDYPSGSNQPGEIEGFAQLGRAVGVAAPDCGRDCEAALIQLAGTSTPVFLDSGAFSEVKFSESGPPVVTRPITPDEWERRLDLYDRLATFLGSQLSVVAPDRVGDQAVTIERLRTYAPRLRRLHELGVRVLVPLQVGALSMEAFDDQVSAVLGASTYQPAIPFNAAPAAIGHVLGFLAHRRPAGVHMLGFGLRNQRAPEVVAALRDALGPQALISMDSNKIRASTGRGDGSKATRPLTRADDAALDRVISEADGRVSGGLGDDGDPLPDITDVIAFPDEWLTPKEIRGLCHALRLPNETRSRCIADLAGWLQSEETGWDKLRMEAALEKAYWAWVERRTSRRRRREAVTAAFAPAPRPATPKAKLALVRARLADINAYMTERHYLHRGRVMAQLGYWLLWTTGDVSALEGDLNDQPAERAPPGQRWTVGGFDIEGGIHFALPRLSTFVEGYHPMDLLELARLYLEPGPDGQNIPDRASQATRRGSDRAMREWGSKYPQLPRPRAVVSWADLVHHTGAIYRAAGFKALGEGRGRRKGVEADGDQEAPRRGPVSQGRHTVRHADFGHAKAGFLLTYRPPGPPLRDYLLRLTFGGMGERLAREVCDLLRWEAGSLGVRRLPGREQMCDWYSGVAGIVLPLRYLTDDSMAYGDVALALQEAAAEAVYESYTLEDEGASDGLGDPWWELVIEEGEQDGARIPRKNPALPLDPASMPPAARQVLARLTVGGGDIGLAEPYPEPVLWLERARLARRRSCAPASETIIGREMCMFTATPAGRLVYQAVLDELKRDMAARQTVLFNPATKAKMTPPPVRGLQLLAERAGHPALSRWFDAERLSVEGAWAEETGPVARQMASTLTVDDLEAAYDAISADPAAVLSHLTLIAQIADDVLELGTLTRDLAARGGIVSAEEIRAFDAEVRRAPSPRRAVAARLAISCVKELRAPWHHSIKSDRITGAARFAIRAMEAYVD